MGFVFTDGGESGSGNLWKAPKSRKKKAGSCGGVHFKLQSWTCAWCYRRFEDDADLFVGTFGGWANECPTCKQWTTMGAFYLCGRVEHANLIQCRQLPFPKKAKSRSKVKRKDMQ